MDLRETFADPTFQGMTPQDQMQYLRETDPDFASMSEPDQQKSWLLGRRAVGQASRAPSLITPPGARMPSPKPYEETSVRIPTDLQNPDLLGTITPHAIPVGSMVAGARMGAPLGPWGAVAGAGLGLGFGGNLERLRSGDYAPDIGTALGRTAQDVKEGATAEMGGQSVAVAIGALVNKLFPALSPAKATARATLEAEKIPFTASEISGGPVLGRAEATLERLPFGSAPLLQRRKAAQGAIERAVGRIADDIRPSGDLVETGREVQKASRSALKARAAEEAIPAESIQQRIGPAITDQETATGVRQGLKRANDMARAEASEKLESAIAIGGDQPVIAPTGLNVASRAIETERGVLGSLANRAERVAGRVSQETAPVTEVQSSMGPIDLSKLPQEVVRQFNLADPTAMTLRQADAVRSRLYAYSRQAYASGDDVAGRQFQAMAKGIDADIDAYAATAPGDFGTTLREARRFYKERVADRYGPEGTLRDLPGMDPREESGALLAQVIARSSPERTALIRDELLRADPSGQTWKNVQRHFVGNLMDAAHAGGSFNRERFLREVQKYSPETVTAVLGRDADALSRTVGLYQERAAAGKLASTDTDPTRLYRELIKANPEAAVSRIVRPKGVTDVRVTKDLVPDETWTKIQRAWLDDVVKRSYTGAPEAGGTFSRRRFLDVLKQYEDDVLKEVLTPKVAAEGRTTYDAISDLRTALQHVEKIRPTVENTSGTAQGVLSAGQLYKAAQLGGSVLVGHTSGILPGAGVILTPEILSRFLASDRGVRLLLDGIRSAPGTAEAGRLVPRMALYMAQEGLAGTLIKEKR